MDYRDAVMKAQELDDCGIPIVRIADKIMEAYEAGKSEREPQAPDAQGYLHVTESFHARLMADHARIDFLSNLADGRIFSSTFSRSNICLTLRDGYGATFRDCVDVAIEEASKP